MATGRIDLFTANVEAGSAYLTLYSSNGSPALAMALPDSAQITLANGKRQASVTLKKLEGREMVSDFMELSVPLARKLGLKPNGRYEATYTGTTHTLALRYSPVSSAKAYLHAAAAFGHSSIGIGYMLLGQLGIPERKGYSLKLQHGTRSAALKLTVPANLDDSRLHISPFWLPKLGLKPGKSLNLKYDQRTSTLTIFGGS